MKHVFRFVGGIVGVLVVAAMLVSCSASSSELEKKTALNIFAELRAGHLNGDQAKGKVGQINSILQQRELKLSDIGTTDGELLGYVHHAYLSDAMTYRDQLKQLRADPTGAESLVYKIKDSLRKAGANEASIGTSATELDRYVSHNALEKAHEKNPNLGVADLKAAGIQPTIIKRVPVRPKAKAPARKSTKRPKAKPHRKAA